MLKDPLSNCTLLDNVKCLRPVIIQICMPSSFLTVFIARRKKTVSICKFCANEGCYLLFGFASVLFGIQCAVYNCLYINMLFYQYFLFLDSYCLDFTTTAAKNKWKKLNYAAIILFFPFIIIFLVA